MSINALVSTFIDQASPSATTGASPVIKVGSNDKLRSIIEFPISNYNVNDTLTSASISLNVVTYPTATITGTAHLLVRESWSEKEASWSNYKGNSSWNTPGGDFYFDLVQDDFKSINNNAISVASYFVAVGSSTGSGVTTAYTAPGNANLVFMKCGTNAAHNMIFRTATMPANMSASVSTGYTTGNFEITAMSSTGFNVGTGANCNTSADAHMWVAVGDPSKSFFIEGEYTGTGVAQDKPLPFTPGMVWIKQQNSANSGVWKSASMPSDESQLFSPASIQTTQNMITSFGKNLFSIGIDAHVNTNGVKYWYMAWAQNVVESGTYTGNAPDTKILSGTNTYRKIDTINQLSYYLLGKEDAISSSTYQDYIFFQTSVTPTGAAYTMTQGASNLGTASDGRYLSGINVGNGFTVGYKESTNANGSLYNWAGLYNNSSNVFKVEQLHGRTPDIRDNGEKWYSNSGTWYVSSSSETAGCSTITVGYSVSSIDYQYAGTTGNNVFLNCNISPGPGTVPTGQGLVFRMKNVSTTNFLQGNYYFIRFTETTSGLRDRVEIKKLVDSTETHLGGSPYTFDWSKDQSYTIKIRLHGSDMFFYINDSYLGSITDTTFLNETKYGLIVNQDTSTKFDVFKLSRSSSIPFTIPTSGPLVISGVENLIRNSFDLGYASLRVLLRQDSGSSTGFAEISSRSSTNAQFIPYLTINNTAAKGVATSGIRQVVGSYLSKQVTNFKTAIRPRYISIGYSTGASTTDIHTFKELVQETSRVPLDGTRYISDKSLGLNVFLGTKLTTGTTGRVDVYGPHATTECGYAKELFFLGAANNNGIDTSYRAVIYEDDGTGTAPSKYIGTSTISSISNSTTGWHRVPFTTKIHIRNNKSYWIGIMEKSEGTTAMGINLYGGSSASYARKSLSSDASFTLVAPPRTWATTGTSGSTASSAFDMYLTYESCLPSFEAKARLSIGEAITNNIYEVGLHYTDKETQIIKDFESYSGISGNALLTTAGIENQGLIIGGVGNSTGTFINTSTSWSSFGLTDHLRFWIAPNALPSSGYTIKFGEDSNNYWQWSMSALTTTGFTNIDLKLQSYTTSVGTPGYLKKSIYFSIIPGTNDTLTIDTVRLVKADDSLMSRSELLAPITKLSTEAKIVTYILQIVPSEELII